jgi:hypothetical protein
MPKTPINYSKTIFYRIVCNDINITDCYVGHTTNFIKRKQQHKLLSNNKDYKDSNAYKYQFIRDNGGWENWSMIMINEMCCNDINDAKRQERLYIEEYQANLNKQLPTRTQTEYQKVNKDKIKKYKNEYQKKNQKLTIFCNCCNKNINLLKRERHFKTKLHIKNSEIVV